LKTLSDTWILYNLRRLKLQFIPAFIKELINIGCKLSVMGAMPETESERNDFILSLSPTLKRFVKSRRPRSEFAQEEEDLIVTAKADADSIETASFLFNTFLISMY
jgi:hypothetical protein